MSTPVSELTDQDRSGQCVLLSRSSDRMSVVRYATFLLLLLLLTFSELSPVRADGPYVIFEDDFDSDSDGPAALCMLLELEAAGECKIIACGHQ